MAPGTAESVERLAGGFQLTASPLWSREGHVLFSDVPENTLYECSAGGRLNKVPSADGGTGPTLPFACRSIVRDLRGRLLLCDATAGRIVRMEPNGGQTVVADRFEGMRLNGPRAATFHADGSLYFTDPPCGEADEGRELPFNGVYRLVEGRRLQLLAADLARPSGLAFSPHQNFLYVANAECDRMIWLRYKVDREGLLTNPVVFHDASASLEEGTPGGLIVDRTGNVLATGPGGIWVFSPAGDHIGTLRVPEIAGDLTWGGDGTHLYIAARTSIYRLRWPVGGYLS